MRNAGSEADVAEGSLSYEDAAGRELRTAGGSVLVDTGDEAAGWSFFNRSQNNGRQVSLSAVPTSETALLLARVEPNVDGGEAERYTFWVNPPLGAPPPEEAELSFDSADAGSSPASDFNEWSDLIAIRLGAGTARGLSPAASWLADEIRIGAGWADVLPWSPPLELLAPLPEPRPDGFAVTWRPAPGRTDVVEASATLLDWTPYEASRRTGVEGETSTRFVCPAPPPGSQEWYVRVRREP